ncbi:MAG: acetyl-CoA carboxylase biotin carboxyl carrier protein subunit, partial [Acidimicrobiales bacterium]|nr:acetyl-CoA carboxylase biotin carboxyl carrier protein subunit [Acidimicrobiales bacterium]
MPDDDIHELVSPLIGTVVATTAAGSSVAAGAPVAVIESMKMEHPVPAPFDCVVVDPRVEPGDQVNAGQAVARVRAAAVAAAPKGQLGRDD